MLFRTSVWRVTWLSANIGAHKWAGEGCVREGMGRWGGGWGENDEWGKGGGGGLGEGSL